MSLDELKDVVEAEEARAALREDGTRRADPARAGAEILEEALGHLERQLALVRRRRDEIDALEGELEARRGRLRALLGGARLEPLAGGADRARGNRPPGPPPHAGGSGPEHPSRPLGEAVPAVCRCD